MNQKDDIHALTCYIICYSSLNRLTRKSFSKIKPGSKTEYGLSYYEITHVFIIFSLQTHLPFSLPPFYHLTTSNPSVPFNSPEGMSFISLHSTIFHEVKVTGISSCHLRKRRYCILSISVESCNIGQREIHKKNIVDKCISL